MSILADLQNGLEQGKMLAGEKADAVFDRVAQHNPIPDEESRFWEIIWPICRVFWKMDMRVGFV